jgi:prepilin-type N-terminal cleavage/methylation domain-containing protein
VFSSYRKIMARKAAGEMDETGFTLIELLIVIVVLGILAGVVIFALGGVTGQSAIAACKADGATASTALAAFNTDNPGVVATTTLLTGTTDSGPFLQSWPSSTHYVYTLPGGVLFISVMGGTPTPALTTAVAYTGSNMTSGSGGCSDITG